MNINNSNVLGLRNGILTKSNSDNNNFYINFCFDRRYNSNLSYNTDLNYNPFTQTLTCPNFIGNITANKVEVTDSDYNGNLKLTFSDGNNNLLDNAGLLYHPFFRILKVESNNSQTYQLLLKNSGQSAGIQIKGAPAVTQYEANITHYLDILKIQNTGSDTEIEQVGSGTIYIYNANGSLTLNGSGNIVASGIYAGNGSLLTNLDSDTIEITDTGDDTDYYLVFTNSAGSGKTLRVNETSSPGDTFTYNPSTNKLSVLRVYCGFIEADNYIGVKTSELTGLIENLQLRNSIITIGSTGINLGNTKTEIAGLTKLGIGTSSPNQQLEVYGKTLLGTEHTFNVFIYNSTTYNNATETFAQNICFQDDSTMRYGLVAVNTNSALTTNKGASIGFGIADTANNVKIGNSIESITNDVNAVTSDLVFKTIGTSDGYVLNTESMRITSAGNVGMLPTKIP